MSDPLITDEAVEAAAEALQRDAWRVSNEICKLSGNDPVAEPWPVNDEDRTTARAMLAAAVPLLRSSVEAHLRNTIADDIQAMPIRTDAGSWDYAPNVRGAAARIARGETT